MAAAASVALASLVALLAANTPSQLDCVCSHVYNETDDGWSDTISAGERRMLWSYCIYGVPYHYALLERCEALEQASPALAALARLAPWNWWQYGAPPAAVGLSCGEECECGAALAEIRGLTEEEAEGLECRMADALADYWSAHGLNGTTWTAETLPEDQQKVSQLLHAARSVGRALHMFYFNCDRSILFNIGRRRQAEAASLLKEHSMYWWRRARLLSLVATHVSQLFTPLALQHTGNHTNGLELHGWIKNMERVREMLYTKLMGLVHDMQFITEHIANYKVEEDKDTPGKYKIRRPLLSDRLLEYQPRFLSFRDDFGALCEQQLPQAPHVFGLADILYSYYRHYYTIDWSFYDINITVEEWQVEDQSNTTVWVDTGCLQLLADAVDQPRCPLEELPLEDSRRRRQCRERLWRDLVERPPRPPVTSYLAYSERAAVSLCLLAWMAANSRGLCQDVLFSMVQSVHDATCYFESPNNQTCLQSNSTDAICSASRAILLLKCRDFSSISKPNLCKVCFFTTGHYSKTNEIGEHDDYKLYGKATETALSFKATLNRATLKYRDFKVESLKPLEYSFIAINILFRLLTASVYVWLPHLRNLPGKILLSFQLTGLAQVLFSEVVYRAAGFPDVSTAVLVDSCLTLLGCLWLNTFSYQMFACVRDLRLPDHLTPAEASIVFRSQLRWAMIPWAMVTMACAALEKSSKNYLMASRITLIVAISSSVALNLVLLGLVAFIYFRNKKSMTRLNIIGDDKGFSKKQLTFMSVNTIILSGICVIIRIGFHQATGIAQYVYFVHIATMLQGPVLFVFLACNGKTLPALKNRLLSLCWPDVYRPELELCSAAEKNLARRRGEPPVDAETAL